MPRGTKIPVRASSGAPMRRSCTVDWKINPIGKELKRRGATKDTPWRVGIGISIDEIGRARTAGSADPRNPEQARYYPLIDLGLRRSDCEAVIRAAGLPVPPKSSCYFCPFHSLVAWRNLKREHPDLFAKAAALEDNLRAKHRSPVWLTAHGQPLAEVVDDQMVLDFGDLDNCETGYCMT